jgi:hypothetical protein
VDDDPTDEFKMNDETIAFMREGNDPDFEPTALDRVLFTLGVQLTALGLTDSAERIADASAVLHYYPNSPQLENDDIRALYDTLSGMAMAAALVASEINEALSLLVSRK